MSNLIKKGADGMVPKDIADMTLRELMASKDVEVHKKDNVLKLKRRMPTETVMVEVRSYDDAAIVSQSRTHRDKPFSQMESTIAKMRAEGKTQAEVADLAAPDSVLFLWATFPQLPEALRLINAWGFTYKSVAFVWLKKNRKSESWFYGLGFWTRGNAEVCLLATRGHPKRQAANVHQFIIAPIQEHSRKPDEARDKIVALMGDVPRVELFARQSPPGWDVWGNEVESTVPDFWTKCPEVAGPERSD